VTFSNQSGFARATGRAAFVAAFIMGLLAPTVAPMLAFGVAKRIRPPIHRELARVVSPSSFQDAVLIESSGGLIAPGSSYEVYVVGHGEPIHRSAPVMTATKATAMVLGWRRTDLLVIGYRRARIEQFTNYWPHRRNRNAGPVEIQLAPVSPGFSYLVPGRNAATDAMMLPAPSGKPGTAAP